MLKNKNMFFSLVVNGDKQPWAVDWLIGQAACPPLTTFLHPGDQN